MIIDDGDYDGLDTGVEAPKLFLCVRKYVFPPDHVMIDI
jgi:hypothetical protein